MSESMEATEIRVVRDVCEYHGYGRVMQLAEQLWREKTTAAGHAGSEHTTGPCATFMVICPHQTVRNNGVWLDANGHCDWCCGCGRVTKKVAHHMKSMKRGGK